jgi:uncharacterized protein YjdB
VTAPTLVSIQLSPQNATIALGATQQFTAIGVYTDGSTQDLTSTATWISSTTVVAVINSSGLAAGVFQGTATVQAATGSVSSSTTLSVGAPALVSIAVTPATATIALGAGLQFQATGTYSDGTTQNVTSLISWSSGTPGVATVTSAGLATGVSQGTVVLSAAFESVTASVSLTVTPPSLVSITVVPNAASLSAGGIQQLSATGIYTDGSTQNLTASSSWASSNASAVGVNSAGLATAVAAGSATITATSGSTIGTATLIVGTGTIQANLNTSRYQHSATFLNNGHILVAGGVNCPTAGSCTYLNSAELYSPATGTFTYTAGSLATARSAPAIQLKNGKVLIAGGYTCNVAGNCSSLISAELYDTTAGTFSSAGNMTVARRGHTVTVLTNGTVLLAGGQNCSSATSCSTLSSAEIYDPVAGTFTGTSNSMSAARFGASAVVLNSGSVLIAGGFDGTNLPAASEIFTPNDIAFSGPGPSLNVPRYHATATLLNNGQVLVAGGSTCNSPGCPTHAAEIYDPAANIFNVVSAMNVPRFHHTATLLTNGDVVIAGGYSACTSSCTSEASTEFFDPVAGAFTSGQPIATAVAGHTGTLSANGDALLIGGINAGVTLASDEWYEPINPTPPGLESITVAPASVFLLPGQTQQLVATGTFDDGSTQILQSVIWMSSNPSAAAVSNASGSAGIVDAQAQGATTLTAIAGGVTGSASLEVSGLVSLAITPANPSIVVGAGQQLTAAGTFVDGSVHDLTSNVTWTSSNNSVVLVGATPGFQGLAMGLASGTATITGTLGSVSASTSVTVQNPTTIIAPNIISVLPPVGAAGNQITIFGSGFGTSQGSGTIWLGSTYGNVMTWNDVQIVATVATISQSGTAQVVQNGLSSNAVSFNVNTATVSTASPASGVPGTPVTISGSGFGAAQGSGQVWLGTANGVVQSWTDGQIVALVGNGALSGNAQVLQNGVMSNGVSFTVNSLNIATVTPNSGGPGTSVTIAGTGFGSAQGNGSVWLGGTNGEMTSWSNTQIVAAVATSALTGVVRVEQNGVLSNAISFTVPTSGGNAVTMIPNVLNLVVGQTQTIQALNASSQPVTGLTWASSSTKIVSLSTDDPPILTALAAGHVSITAGTASADVTVSSETLQPGTVIWSNPGDGSGVTNIVPAVPSATGVADVFATQADGTVQAITSSGSTAWTANLNGANYWQILPDFQGGLVIPKLTTPQSITKRDGITGQAYPAYTPATQNDSLSMPVLHTNGTTFTVDTNVSANTVALIGFNPTTATKIFSVPLDQSITSYSGSETGSCNGISPGPPFSATYQSSPNFLAGPIVAGDGYAYVAYTYQVQKNVNTYTYGCNSDDVLGILFETSTTDTLVHLMVLRVGSDGDSRKIDIKDWDSKYMVQYPGSGPNLITQVGQIPSVTAATPITNADQGSVLTWQLNFPAYCASGVMNGACNTAVSAASTFGFAATVGTTVAYEGSTAGPIYPVLQAQDRSFFGTDGGFDIIRFDQSGNTIWSVPNDSPEIATADGGVIGASGITYDSQGRANGQIATPIQSWTAGESGIAYQYGSVDQTAFTPAIIYATPDFSSFSGVNQSGNGTSAPCHDNRDNLVAEYPKYGAGYLPVCFASEFVPSSNTYPDLDFSFSVLNQDDLNYAKYNEPYSDWAILKSSMLDGLERWFHNYGQPLTLFAVTSGYRSPYVQYQIGQSQKSPHPKDEHIHGDAVDVASSSTTWPIIRMAAWSAQACVEPFRVQKNYGHVHGQWKKPCPQPDWAQGAQ